ncbi:MAG: PAS domain S-box protein [Spirulinaceae cyanobacterium SM2_1_0]|nr:PAS domain S-box protein [Spirulinaceae cyanobacterium SM2_1_0]
MASSPTSSAGHFSARTATVADAQRFRKLVANIPGTIYSYVLRPDGSDAFTYVSDNLREIYELEPAAVMRNAELLWKCLHPEDLDKLTETLAQSAQQLTRWQVEWRIVTPSGQLKWVSGIAQPERQADGSIVWDGIFLDISDRKQAEEQRYRNEQLYHALARNFPNGVVLMFDRDCRYTLVDGESELAVLGMSKSQLEGKTPHDILPTAAATELVAIYQQALQGQPIEAEFVLGDRLYSINCVPIRDEFDQVMGGLAVGQNITERRRSEQEQARLVAILEATSDLVSTCEVNGNILYFNRAGRELLGIGDRALSDLAAEQLHPRWALDRIQGEAIPHALQHGSWQGETAVLSATGEEIPVSQVVMAHRDAQGELAYLSTVIRDLRERQRVETELRQTTERLQEAQRIAHLGHWELDAATQAMTWSPEMFRIFGLDPQQGTPTMEEHAAQIYPEDREHHQRAFTSLLTGRPTEVEFRIVQPSGDRRYLNVRAEAVLGLDGRHVRYVGTTVDITERKQAEQTLQDNAELFRAIFDQAAIGLCYVEPDASISRVNGKLCEILGYSEAELLQQNFQDITHPDDQAIDWTYFERIFAGEMSRFVVEKRYRHADGHWVWANVSVSVVRANTGEPRFFIGAIEDISDRRAAEQRARELLAILEAAPDFIGSATLEGYMTYLNPIGHQLLGIDPDANLDQLQLVQLHPPTSVELLTQTGIPSAIAHGTWLGETELLRPDGSTIPVSQAIIAHYDESGAAQYISTIVRDIAANKQAERQLREQTILLRAVLDSIPQAVFWKDRAGIYLGCNQRFARDAGYRHSAELVGRDDRELPWHKEAAEHYRKHDRRVMELGRGSINVEEPITLADGRRGWLQTSKVPLTNADSEIIGVLGVYDDITERKAIEEDLRDRVEREALFNRLTNQIRNSLDVETIIDTAVHALRDLLEIDRANISWYHDAEPEAYWETTKESKREDLPSLLGRYPTSEVGSLTEVVLRGETVRIDEVTSCPEPIMQQFLLSLGYTSFLTVPLVTGGGRCGVWGAGHCTGARPWTDTEIELVETIANQMAIALNQADLYEQAQAKTRELEAAYRELQETQTQLIQSEKMSSLGQLVAGVAHEINNPVNFIYGNIGHANEYLADLIDLLEQYNTAYPDPTPEIVEAIDAIDLDFLLSDLPKLFESMRFGADRIKEIVKSLRTFSRLDEADMKAIDLHENLDSTLMILQSRLKAKPERPAVQVIKNYGQLPKIDCYAGQLNQVFINLIGNAIDAIDEQNKRRAADEIAAEPGTITIGTAAVGDRVHIRIKDNGTGIPANKLNRIFDPFYTTKAVGKGTGLGLSISYQIVTENHRGRLDCQSELGRGTEFVIEIPQCQPEMT